MSQAADQISISVETAERGMKTTLNDLEKESAEYTRKANRDRRYYHLSTVIIILLTALTPALIAYAAQGAYFTLGLLGAVLAGFGGALATIRGTFQWDANYRRYLLTALDLSDVRTKALTEMEIITSKYLVSERATALDTLNKKSRDDAYQIKRNAIVNEISMFTRMAETESKSNGQPASPSGSIADPQKT